MGIWLTLASPWHFFTFRVFNMEFGCIRRDCDTAKVRRNEKSMHFLRFKFGVISRPNILLTGRKPTKHPKVPRKCQKHCQTPILHICHFFYTTTIWGLKILHLKVRKCTAKVASRQNSVNLHSGAQIHISNHVWNIKNVCKILQFV